jgi:aspartate kinase
MAGETNRLLALAKEIQPHPDPRELDVVAATGEQVTIGLLAMALLELGVASRSYAGWQVKVLTDAAFTQARIVSIDEERVREDLKEGRVAVVAGFQGVDRDGNITYARPRRLGHFGGCAGCGIQGRRVPDLHRRRRRLHGRSADRSGGAAPEDDHVRGNARDGGCGLEDPADPLGRVRRQVQGADARPLESHRSDDSGRARKANPARWSRSRKIPIWQWKKHWCPGSQAQRDEAKVTVRSVPDRPGIAYAILGPIADAGINVDVIVQNVGQDGMTDLSFTVARSDLPRTLKLLKDQVQPHIKCREVSGEDRIAKVSIVGMGMRSHAGIAARMFRTLAEEGINIQMISTSEIKLTVVIDEKYTELAVRVLHRAFELDQE